MGIIRIVFIFVVGLVAQAVEAQQSAKVKSFSMTTDHIPGDYRRNDMNNTPCALLKVQVIDDIEGVDGNKIGDIVDRGVEKWVYLCKGSRNVRLRLKNHLPIRVVFKDYQIPSLESNRVYELVIDLPTQAPIDMSGVKGNDLQLKLIPKDALFVIWGDNLAKRLEHPQPDGLLKLRLPYGRYYYAAEANGFIRKEGGLFVNDEDKIIEVRLAPLESDLVVSCPMKVDVFVNGVKLENRKGKQWTGRFPVGRYFVEARAKHCSSRGQWVEIHEGQTAKVDFPTLLTERELKKKGLSLTDEAASLRENVLKARVKVQTERETARLEYQRKMEAYKKANTYDIINMKDGSIILCMVTDVNAKNIVYNQKGISGTLLLPVRLVKSIQYGDGAVI
ncbi:MAG: hypothetical protein J6O49_11870, partial [Bacteroidaceae bacterium]|nr:hypothetical protein [Bacteroidaceae bacterium]